LPGYLLFATNGQINVLVPGALSTVTTAGVVNVQVGYDTATPAAVGNSSAVFPLNAVTSNPGVFTVFSNGRGAGAVTDATSFALNTQSAAATSTTDTVAIYMTGLGIPNGAGADVVNGSPATDGAACLVPLGAAGSTSVAPGGFMGAVNTPYNTGSIFSPATGFTVPAWTSIDGAVIRSALTATSRLASSLPVVTIGGAAATVSFAGFVADSIGGLYQINAVVPTPTVGGWTSGTPSQVQILVTINGNTSQTGAMIWVQ
jgi:hypothetical protein